MRSEGNRPESGRPPASARAETPPARAETPPARAETPPARAETSPAHEETSRPWRDDSGERLARLAANLPGVIFALTMAPGGELCLRFASEGTRDVFGVEPEALVRDFALVIDNVHAQDVHAFTASLRDSARTLARWEWSGRAFAADGSVRYVRAIAAPQRDGDGATSWDGVLLDETEVWWARELEAAMRRRLQLIVEHLPAASVALYDRSLRLCFCEGQLFADVDISALLGKPLPDLVGASTLELLLPGLRAAIAGQPAPPVVLERDGRGRTLSVSFAPYRLADGRIDGALVHFKDISELRQAERARREAEERFGRAFEDAATGMAMVAVNGRWLRVNRALCETVGYSEGELLAGRVHDITHPDDVGAIDSNIRAMLTAREGRYSTEKRYVHRDGHTVWARVSVSVIRDDDGLPRYLVSQIEDISERKRSEQQLARARAQIDRFFGMSLDLMAISDSTGAFVRVNRAFTRTLGYETDELVNRPSVDFVHPDDVAATLAMYARQRDGQEAVEFENRYRCKDGSHRWLLWNATALEDGFIYATARDMTERREMEQRLRDSREHALATSRLKSEFVANMSHEIRTPLNGVVSMAQLLLETELSDEQREYAQVAASSAHVLTRVVDDILDFSKVEAGKLELVEEDFSIAAVIAEVCDIVEPRAREKQIALSCEVDASVAPLQRGDGGRLRQVLMNLVGNAVKFTLRGEVAVRVAAAGQRLRIEVADTGIGIAPEQLDRLFAPFGQADATTTRRFGGTGLGLSIAKQLTELMGGHIDVTSQPGRGSTFSVVMPCRPAIDTGGAPSRPAADTGAGRSRRAAALTRAPAPAGPPRPALIVADPAAPHGRVLVAEDNEINQFVATKLLHRLGYAVDVAADGRQAVKLAASGRYAAVFMDCQMPQLDGYEATAAIRAAEPARERVPIIAMTASTMPGDRERCLAAGMDDYVPKPLLLEDVADVCDRLMSAADAAPVAFDGAALHEVVAPDQAGELLELFLQQLAQATDDLHELAVRGDAGGVHRVAHRLKGSASVVGAHAVAAACQDICARTRGDAAAGEELPELTGALDAVAGSCRSAITAHLRAVAPAA